MKHEEAIKVVKIVDGCNACNVGFIPRVQSHLPDVIDRINKFALVKQLYYNTDN